MEDETRICCTDCRKEFSDSFSLKEHIRKTHRANIFRCECCGYTAKFKYILDRHIKSHYNVSLAHKKHYTCPLCNQYESVDRSVMINHYTSEHGVSLQTKTLEFDGIGSFNAWKSELEKKEVCYFTASSGTRNTENKRVKRLRCFRDGFYVPRGKGMRNLKTKGSNKIGAVCPASVSVSEDVKSGAVRATYQSTHVGHSVELNRLHLQASDKADIAQKLAAQVPFDEILDDIRQSSTASVERIHLITRKDLWNIGKTFNLSVGGVRHSSGQPSVETWVSQVREETSLIRFYKSQGSKLSSHPDLTEEDFILILANDAQLELLKRYGPDCIILDSTHGLSGSAFELTTLLVIDDLQNGFPCAFMLSSRSDVQIISLFIEILRLSLVSPIETSVLMTDVSDHFYKGWCNVMPAPKRWLFSAWHVDHAWREYLFKVSGGTEKKAMVYKTVASLLEENDENVFLRRIRSFVKKLKCDPDTRDFGNYFEREFSNNYASWAFCFRKYCDTNTNMHIEKMHEALKTHLERKKVKRLDRAIHALMRFTRDNLYDCLTAQYTVNLSTKISDVRNRHRRARDMENCDVVATIEGWSVTSQLTHEKYNVVKVDRTCDCDVKCEECGICFHSFRCTCVDSEIEWSLCLHIHKVCMFLLESDHSALDSPEQSTMDCIPVNDDSLEGLCLYDTLCTIPSSVIVSEELSETRPSVFEVIQMRHRIAMKFNDILNDATCESDLKIIDDALTPLRRKIDSLT